MEERNKKISATKQNKSNEERKLYSKHISESLKGKLIGNIPWNKGKQGVQEAWNKGLTYTISDDSKKNMILKRYNTQKENGTLGINQDTKVEVDYYNYLLSMYNKEDICHPYIDKDRYPFKCDFYIKSEDKFIEVHGNWTHGGRPFDPEDEECRKQLEIWQEKAKNSNYYKNAIYTWTNLDVRKAKIAKENNLNFEVIY